MKNHDKPYMAKKANKSVTQGRKNKVLKRHIDLAGSNKMPILDKSPMHQKNTVMFNWAPCIT